MVVISPKAVQMFLGGKSHMLRGDDVRDFKDSIRGVIERDGIDISQVQKVRVYDDCVRVKLPGRIHNIAFANTHVASFQERYNLADRVAKLGASGPVTSDLKSKTVRSIDKLGDLKKTASLVDEIVRMRGHDQTNLTDRASIFGVLGVATSALGVATAYEDVRDMQRLGVNAETQTMSRFKFRVAIGKLGLAVAKSVRIMFKLVKSSLPGLKLFGQVLGGISGVSAFIGFGTQLYTFVKKEHFYSQLKNCARGVQDEAEKARQIFNFLQATGQINEVRLETQKDALGEYGEDAAGLNAKLRDLEQSHRDAMGYRFETIGVKFDSMRQWVKGKLGLNALPSNGKHTADMLAQEYMEKLQNELTLIEQKELDPVIQLEMKHALVDAARMKIHKEEAVRARAKEVSQFASSTLASQLTQSLEKVDIENRLDQIQVVHLHAKLLEERRGERFYDIVGMVTNIADAVIKAVSIANPALGAIVWMGRLLTLKDFTDVLFNNFGGAIASAFGVSLESAATREVKDIFKRFKQKRIVDITHVAAQAA